MSSKPKQPRGRPKGPDRADLCISAPTATIQAFKTNAAKHGLSQGKYLTALIFMPSLVHGSMVNPASGDALRE
jgi:hypothetical protein